MTSVAFRGGCVLALGTTPNLTEGDVLIEDDRIAEVGRGLRVPRDAEVVDATDTIVMPGFVDTHRHTWTSLFRNLGEDDGSAAGTLQEHYGADDVYAAALIGLLGAIEAGVTTVVDHWDLAFDEAAVEAALRAHTDAGVRTVFVVASDDLPSRDALAGLAERAGPVTTLALGARADDTERVRAARSAARELGWRLFVHAAPATEAPHAVADLAAQGRLDRDVTLVHHTALDDADLRAIADAGVAVSLAPSSEMATGHGSPPIQGLMDRDVSPGLGVDHERVAPGDLFAQMRQTISLQHATVFDRKLMGKGSLPKLMSTRDVIRYATVDGARVAGLGVVGSLQGGMQADVLVLRTDRPNIWPINDPIGAVVWGMDTSNVDRVLVGGRTLLHDGALRADVERARELAAAAHRRVATAAGLATVASGARP